jgi:CheY-like chemotaxis protein
VVVPVIEAALDVIRPSAETKGISLSTEYRSDLLTTITCDQHRLQQMVWNLLTNAVKFTSPGGRIEVKFEQSGESIQIIVSDTGQGISPEFLPYVFDRFRQADSTSTRSHSGLGLGLAIVRHLAELHGGSVTAASEGKNKGSIFTISLPFSINSSRYLTIDREKLNGNLPKKNSDPKLSGVRVLIVDDDVDTCEMLSFALKQWGAETQASISVSEAFASLSKWVPDILLTDINMPGEDGYALISKLRALPAEMGANIPAIALTAMARPEDREHALSTGFQFHLAKPVDIEELAAAIVNLTGKPA